MNRRVEDDKFAAFLKEDLNKGVQFYISPELKQRMEARYQSVENYVFMPVKTVQLLTTQRRRREEAVNRADNENG